MQLIDKNLNHLNFVLFNFNYKEKGFKQIENKWRMSSKTIRCSVRSEYTKSGIKFSIKQFLYDWSAPAYDHPNLWKSPSYSYTREFIAPICKLEQNNYIWVGINYKDQKAASFNKYRTQIELTVLQGNMSNNEIFDIMSALKPIDENQKTVILNCSLAKLTHMYKYQSKIVSAPMSYYEYLRSDNYSVEFCDNYKNNDLINLSQFHIEQYELDSVFLYTNDNQVVEKEYYFEYVDEKGIFIRIIVLESDENDLKFSSQQICNERSFFITNIRIRHFFSKNNHNGSHSLVFLSNGLIFNIILKPTKWTSMLFVESICHSLIKYISNLNKL